MREDFFVDVREDDLTDKIQELSNLSLSDLITAALAAEPGQPFWLAVGVLIRRCKNETHPPLTHQEFAKMLFHAGIARPQDYDTAIVVLRAFQRSLPGEANQ